MGFRIARMLSFSAICLSISCSAEHKVSEQQSQDIPKNIIMVVGDGMGPAYTTAYRYFNDKNLSNGVDQTIFDELHIGSASTYPAPVSGLVTDSAAGATALATGVKTYNGAVAVDVNKKPLNTALREAKRLGMKTGIVVTSQIVHATPASYVTHNESRRNYNQIADRFFDDRINNDFVLDIMLGGGTDYFKRADRDLVTEFEEAGFQFADTYSDLSMLSNKPQRILGLFAPIALPWALDDVNPHRLSFMTEQAIKHLENNNGFFLLIEASLIDWAGHANDIASALAEMDDLASTMKLLQRYVNLHPDTLVVLTADHSTGGITLGAGGDYRWEPSYLGGLKSSPAKISTDMQSSDDPVQYVESQIGFALNKDERIALLSASADPDQRKRESVIKDILDHRSNTGWTTSGHTGIDVPVFATGAGHRLFSGSVNNTDIGKTMLRLLKQKSVQ